MILFSIWNKLFLENFDINRKNHNIYDFGGEVTGTLAKTKTLGRSVSCRSTSRQEGAVTLFSSLNKLFFEYFAYSFS